MEHGLKKFMSGRSEGLPLKVTLVYALLGTSWIYFSDKLVGMLARDPEFVVRLSMVKGFVYILVTTALLFIMIHRGVLRIKRTEEALCKREMEYQELVENANSIILRMDPIGNVTFVNEFAQRFFGYSEEELLGKNVVGTIVPQVESMSGRDLRSMIEDIGLNPDCYASHINENMCRSGERVWVAWTNKAIRCKNGRLTELLCVGNDVTERKQAEDALKRANILLLTQNETSIDGIFVVDEKDVIVSANQRFADMWGLSRKEVDGKNDNPVLQTVVQKVKNPREFLHRVDYLYAHRNETSLEEVALKDGRTFERYSAPMIGTDEKYYGRVWYFRDITERKLMEKIVAEAEGKYRDIFENSVTGIYQVTLDGRFLTLNTTIAGILGYDSSAT